MVKLIACTLCLLTKLTIETQKNNIMNELEKKGVTILKKNYAW